MQLFNFCLKNIYFHASRSSQILESILLQYSILLVEYEFPQYTLMETADDATFVQQSINEHTLP